MVGGCWIPVGCVCVSVCAGDIRILGRSFRFLIKKKKLPPPQPIIILSNRVGTDVVSNAARFLGAAFLIAFVFAKLDVRSSQLQNDFVLC